MSNSRPLALAALAALAVFAAHLTAGCGGPASRPAVRPVTATRTEAGPTSLALPPAPEFLEAPEAPKPPKPAHLAGPVLVVPASDEPLCIAVAFPEDAELGAHSAWRLVPVASPVEEGRFGDGIPAEIMALEGGAGTPGTRLLVATIPPGGAEGQTPSDARPALTDGTATPRRFRLRPDGNDRGRHFAFRPASDKSLALDAGGRPLLVYNHGTISRDGVPERYNRANYFHPVYGLDGEVMTDDFPKDHRHHRGVFWAWTSVRAGEGKKNTFESWIPRGFEYRFERWTCRHAGATAAAIGAETEWRAGGREIVHERMLVVAHGALGRSRAVDFEFTWTAVDRPVVLKGAAKKGYGGFTFRSAPRKDTVITAPGIQSGPGGAGRKRPGGRAKKDLVAKRLPWADISGTFEGPPGQGPVTSGAAVFVAPDHPDFPPTWLTRHYGPLCVGWPGLEEGTLEPGKPVTCRYRMWFHRGIPDAGAIQAAYDAYAKGLEAHWEER